MFGLSRNLRSHSEKPMIFDPQSEIGNYTELDVECDECGRPTTITRPDEAACERLIDGFLFKEAVAELELLNRAAAVFDSPPDSNHRYVTLTKYRERVINPEDDSLMQEIRVYWVARHTVWGGLPTGHLPD